MKSAFLSTTRSLTRPTLFVSGALLILAVYVFGPLFHTGIPTSHDATAQIARFAAYVTAFRDGNIPPRWAGNLNYHFGSPVLNFYYPLGGYIAALLWSTGLFTLETVYKLMAAAVFTAPAITFYLWVRRHSPSKTAAAVSILYGLAPFHFADLYVRGDIAELLSLTFVPMVLSAVDRYAEHSRWKSLTAGGVWYALVILSHNGIALMFSPVLCCYMLMTVLVKKKRRTLIVPFTSMLVTGLTLSVFFWVPAVYEARYTQIRIFVGDMYRQNFPAFLHLFSKPWGFGPNVHVPGGFAPQLGLLPTILGVFAVAWTGWTRRMPIRFRFWLIVLVISIFLMTPLSSPVWEFLPLLQNLQFPWRLMAVAGFSLAAMLSESRIDLNNAGALLIVILTVLSIRPYIAVPGYEHYSDHYYFTFPGTTYYHGEASTVWSAGDPGDYPTSPISVIAGEAGVTDYTRTSVRHTFTVNASGSAKLVDNTLYYPGWTVLVNGNPVPIEFQDQNYRGLITFAVPAGTSSVSVRFGETRLRAITDIISLTACSLLGIFTIMKLRRS